MFPVILQIGPIVVYSLWFFVGLALLLSVFVFTYLTRQKRLQINFIYNHSFAIFLWGLIGARLLFVLKFYPMYFQDFSISSFMGTLYIWDKGLSLLGALIGITIAIIYFSIKEQEQTKKWLDILTISVISGMIPGHFGAFLDGTSYGRESSLPWGMIFESPSIKYAVPIHPTQLYAMLYSAIIALVLFLLYKKNIVKQGTIMYAGIISYFTMMFLEGFVRGDDVYVLLLIREEQWLSLIVLITTGSYLFYRYNKNKKKQSSDTLNHA